MSKSIPEIDEKTNAKKADKITLGHYLIIGLVLSPFVVVPLILWLLGVL